MRNNELKNLKSRLEVIRASNESIYLKLNDIIYKTIGAGGLQEVGNIPDGATVEEVDCDKEHFVYLFQVNGKAYYCNVMSVTEAIENGSLIDDKGWLDRNDI